MRYTFERGAPNETVRAAQQALHDEGYYRGATDGILGPDVRAAIWKFQTAQGLKRSAGLAPATVAALGLATTGTAATVESSASASPSFAARLPVRRRRRTGTRFRLRKRHPRYGSSGACRSSQTVCHQ